MTKKTLLLIAAVLILLAGCTTDSSQPLRVEGAWARPALVRQNSAIYFTVRNPNAVSDKLISATTDVAGQTELHRSMEDEQGVMSMHPQHAVSVPGRGQLELSPGDLHVMLVDLKQDLKAGDMFELTLQFEKNGSLSIVVPVR